MACAVLITAHGGSPDHRICPGSAVPHHRAMVIAAAGWRWPGSSDRDRRTAVRRAGDARGTTRHAYDAVSAILGRSFATRERQQRLNELRAASKSRRAATRPVLPDAAGIAGGELPTQSRLAGGSCRASWGPPALSVTGRDRALRARPRSLATTWSFPSPARAWCRVVTLAWACPKRAAAAITPCRSATQVAWLARRSCGVTSLRPAARTARSKYVERQPL
jgi:hypothetical protein